MVAVRKFDEESTLQAIMEVFWRQRFEHTSIDDLEAATGVKRGSLYNAYGGKEALFLLALERYGEKRQDPLLRELEGEGINRVLQHFFGLQLKSLSDTALPPGCFIANALAEVGCGEAELDIAIRNRLGRTETALYDRLVAAQAAGEIRPGADVRALARFLLAIMLILPILHRATGDQRMVEDVVSTALQVMDRPGNIAETD